MDGLAPIVKMARRMPWHPGLPGQATADDAQTTIERTRLLVQKPRLHLIATHEALLGAKPRRLLALGALVRFSKRAPALCYRSDTSVSKLRAGAPGETEVASHAGVPRCVKSTVLSELGRICLCAGRFGPKVRLHSFDAVVFRDANDVLIQQEGSCLGPCIPLDCLHEHVVGQIGVRDKQRVANL